MANYTLPIVPGQVIPTANTGNAAVITALLGRSYVKDGKTYRFVKAAAGLAAPANMLLVSALTAGKLTYVVNTSTTANDVKIVGGCVTGQTAALTGDGFLVQCGGTGDLLSAAAIATDVGIGCSTTAGKVDDLSITYVGAAAVSLESAAGADELVGCRFINLI